MLVACTLLLAAVMVLGIGIGSVRLSPSQVWQVIAAHLSGHPRNTVADEIVWQIRMPRVLLAALVGAALTTAGTVVQALVRNALADPFLLGVSSGASVGATAVLLFGAFASSGVWALSVGSVLGAMGAMAAVFFVSRSGRQLAPTQLILCGVVLSAMFEAISTFLLFRGNPQATQSVLFWLEGSFGNANWTQLPIPAAALVLGMGYLLAQARSLNALSMGAEPAASLGVDVASLRRNLFVVTSLMVGVAVAVSGVIGFVGLVIPHIVRPARGFRSPAGAGGRSASRCLVHGRRRSAGPDHRLPRGDAHRCHHRIHRGPHAAGTDPTASLPLRGHPVSLQLQGVSVDLGGRRIVSSVDLAVGDGQLVGLIGPNGSGKSTVLKTIYRANRPAAGRVLIDGVDLLALTAKQAARRVAVVAQETTIEFDFTVWEMVMIGRTPHKRSFERDNSQDRDIVAGALQRVGCADMAHRSYNTLSGGEKQRALIARALAQEADHLILDEPTNHLDIRYQLEVLELVAGLGVTALAALHDLSLAALFCDRAYLMADGRIVTGGPPAQVITAETVRHAYGADVLVIDHPETATPHLIPRRRRASLDVQSAPHQWPGPTA